MMLSSVRLILGMFATAGLLAFGACEDEDGGGDTNSDPNGSGGDNNLGEETSQLTCSDLILTADLDAILGGPSGFENSMPDRAEPLVCDFDYKEVGAGSISVFEGSLAYDQMVAGIPDTYAEGTFIETNAVGAKSLETTIVEDGDAWIGILQLIFLDSTSRYAVTVTLANRGTQEEMDVIHEIGAAVNRNLGSL